MHSLFCEIISNSNGFYWYRIIVEHEMSVWCEIQNYRHTQTPSYLKCALSKSASDEAYSCKALDLFSNFKIEINRNCWAPSALKLWNKIQLHVIHTNRNELLQTVLNRSIEGYCSTTHLIDSRKWNHPFNCLSGFKSIYAFSTNTGSE